MSRLPGEFRRRLLVRLDGAGFSHQLLEHIAAGGGVPGRSWEFSPALVVHRHRMDAIAQVRPGARTPAIDHDGEILPDTFVADLTGLLDLGRWTAKIPGLRILMRDEPGHPLPQAGH